MCVFDLLKLPVKQKAQRKLLNASNVNFGLNNELLEISSLLYFVCR